MHIRNIGRKAERHAHSVPHVLDEVVNRPLYETGVDREGGNKLSEAHKSEYSRLGSGLIESAVIAPTCICASSCFW